MTPGRLVHKATDGLPKLAWDIMIDGFRNKRKYRQIAIDLAQAGFHVAESTLGRRAQEWRSEQVRREAMKIALTEAPRTDLLEEALTALEVLDVSPGWALRARRRGMKAVLAFFDAASMENAQAVKRELLRFRLETVTAQARLLGVGEGQSGIGLGAQDDRAGEAGGGHDENSK